MFTICLLFDQTAREPILHAQAGHENISHVAMRRNI
jgi:hypothetical protein